MGDFPSGQRGQTVNLLATPSVVRIHHLPPIRTVRLNGSYFFVLIFIFYIVTVIYCPFPYVYCDKLGFFNFVCELRLIR